MLSVHIRSVIGYRCHWRMYARERIVTQRVFVRAWPKLGKSLDVHSVRYVATPHTVAHTSISHLMCFALPAAWQAAHDICVQTRGLSVSYTYYEILFSTLYTWANSPRHQSQTPLRRFHSVYSTRQRTLINTHLFCSHWFQHCTVILIADYTNYHLKRCNYH